MASSVSLRRIGLATVPLVLVVLSACSSGSDRCGVSGTVKYKGQPIKAGTITFLNETTNSAVGGAPITDGKYEIPESNGLKPGTYKVSINYPDPSVPPAPADAPPGEAIPVPELLPPQYNRETTLKKEIKPGGEPLDFNLS
jgi:hypothetical protein